MKQQPLLGPLGCFCADAAELPPYDTLLGGSLSFLHCGGLDEKGPHGLKYLNIKNFPVSETTQERLGGDFMEKMYHWG